MQAIITYSQSTDPDSPHLSDMTQVFSDQEWVKFPYRFRDVWRNQIDSKFLWEKR
ncbi:MAG: penicillin acylase family protein [Myxococcota bacterium]|nr:penicillin acylase family protein [Myxococcota bacterium]